MGIGMWVLAGLAGAYVLIGLWVAIFGVQSAQIRIDLRNFRNGTIKDHAFNPDWTPPAVWRWITFAALIGGFVVLAWPIVLYQRHRERREIVQWQSERRFGFSDMAGAGTLVCKDCGHRQDIVGFVHGGHECDGQHKSWSRESRQCQTCHRIVSVDDNQTPPCECGGELARDKPVLCPSCAGSNLTYDVAFLT